MATFKVEFDLDIEGEEKDFYNQIFEDNEGRAIQELGEGRATGLANLTDADKKAFGQRIMGENFSQIFNNTQDQKAAQAVVKARQEARKK